MRIEKRSKKRTEIAFNDRTNAPDVYNYLCIAENEHIHLLCFRSSAFFFRLLAFFSVAAVAVHYWLFYV